jgi:Flp pilus assembly protein CpaB
VNRSTLFALVGLIGGTLGAVEYASEVREDLAGGPLEEWLIVKKDVARGQVLDADALDVALIPAAYSDPRRIPAREREALVGIVVSVGVKAGEGLYWSDVAGGEQAGAHLAEVIPAGRRAFRLAPTANPFGALVEAGDLVDVLCAGSTATHTVLERALVLAVGEKVARHEVQTKSKTARSDGLSLSVLPEEAEALLAAEKSCQLKVVLRSPEDLSTRPKLGPRVHIEGAERDASSKEVNHGK